MNRCEICNGKTKTLYDGVIREGMVGQVTKEPRVVLKCLSCKSAFLEEYNVDYSSEEYRILVNNSNDIENYYLMYDKDQLDKFVFYSPGDYRDKSVMDVGCGGGSFLDLLKGVAGTTIGIEPNASYGKEIKRKNHIYYSYTDQCAKERFGEIDLATSFTVIEHVENPISFLKDIYNCLDKNGSLILSTPNADDWLIDFIGRPYQEFFYRTVHKWYFNGESIENIGKEIGFKSVQIMYKQKFDFSNLLFWLKDKKPTGLNKTNNLASLSPLYKHVLEEEGRADYLYAKLIK